MSEAERDVIEAARRWADTDPDPETVAELERLIDANDRGELAERMNGSLEFGTAGLRGIVAAGSNRMNVAVIRRTAAGLARYLKDKVLDARTLPVVVGRDARLSSERFQRETLGVLAAAGITVRYFPDPVPTPLVAYAVRELGASAGVCVTASHNPPEYNGFKVYAGNGAQIIPPTDAQIAERIAAAGPAGEVRFDEEAAGGKGPRAEPVPAGLIERYFSVIDAMRLKGPGAEQLRIVYTPLHGVGDAFVHHALALAGFRDVTSVAEQAAPDGRFPTVSFPNPEEPGALDAAIALAEEIDADIILANDPDADRLSVCAPTPAGRWQQLSGNQIGLLLADARLAAAPPSPQPLVVSSIVSSPMLGSVAAAHGAEWERTLTGFKWIWNAAIAREAEGGVRFAFSYEEALGYSVNAAVRDKDGITAALDFAAIVAREKAAGRTVRELLADLYRRHGLWVSRQRNIVLPGSEGKQRIAEAMERLGAAPPAELAGRGVAEVRDFRSGGAQRPAWLPDADLIELSLGDAGRVLARPSGTEPKLKIYVDLRAELGSDDSMTQREKELSEAAAELASDLVRLLELED